MQVTFLLFMFVFLIIALRNPSADGVVNALLFAVALAVGLTPELLPIIMTINLTRGALAMSKKGVIVKRLSLIENFGSMNVLPVLRCFCHSYPCFQCRYCETICSTTC